MQGPMVLSREVTVKPPTARQLTALVQRVQMTGWLFFAAGLAWATRFRHLWENRTVSISCIIIDPEAVTVIEQQQRLQVCHFQHATMGVTVLDLCTSFDELRKCHMDEDEWRVQTFLTGEAQFCPTVYTKILLQSSNNFNKII